MRDPRKRSQKKIIATVSGVAVVVGALAMIQPSSREVESKVVSSATQEERERSSEGGTVRTPPPSPGKFLREVEKQEKAIRAIARWKASSERLEYLQNCLTEDGCAFSNENPWSYDMDVQLEIAKELRSFKALVLEAEEVGVRDARSAGEKLARHFLLVGNDDVKEAAFELLSLTHPSLDNLTSIMVALNETASGPLMRHGLAQLRRYSNTEWSAKVDRFLMNRVRLGGIQVAREVSRGILDFVNRDNLEDYKALLKTVPARSQAHLYLRRNIEEAQRLTATN